MTTGAIDSAILGELFTTPEMRALFADAGHLRRMLEVEVALARAQARLGLIPAAAAEEIAAAACRVNLDPATIGEETALVGYPVVPLIKALSTACTGDAGRYVHWGATTQDIMDTALVLQIRDAFALLEADLAGIEAALAGLATRHRDTPMAGRTHLQHALPITFGFRCALWLAMLRRRRAALARLRGEVLVVQFGGAVGTLASLGEDGIRVMEALAEELDLGVPEIAWHACRDRPAEVATSLALLAGALGKVATDVVLLSQTEIGEVAEPHVEGRGGSSTMPQKRNPIACELILACARNVQQLVPVMLEAMLADHERATGPWHAEWVALPQIFALTAGAVRHSRRLLEGLVVDPERMRRNLDATGGLIMAEAVMMALAPMVGRQQAHHLVASACDRAIAQGASLLDVLIADVEICRHLSVERLRALLEPESYTGLAGAFVDRVLTPDA